MSDFGPADEEEVRRLQRLAFGRDAESALEASTARDRLTELDALRRGHEADAVARVRIAEPAAPDASPAAQATRVGSSDDDAETPPRNGSLEPRRRDHRVRLLAAAAVAVALLGVGIGWAAKPATGPVPADARSAAGTPAPSSTDAVDYARSEVAPRSPVTWLATPSGRDIQYACFRAHDDLDPSFIFATPASGRYGGSLAIDPRGVCDRQVPSIPISDYLSGAASLRVSAGASCGTLELAAGDGGRAYGFQSDGASIGISDRPNTDPSCGPATVLDPMTRVFHDALVCVGGDGGQVAVIARTQDPEECPAGSRQER